MARMRMIHPQFWVDENMLELPFEARLFYIGTWNFADDYGNLPNSPRRLKMQIFPADLIDVEPMIADLVRVGCLQPYEADGQSCLHVKAWETWQKIDWVSRPVLPLFPGQTLISKRTRRTVTDQSTSPRDNSEGKENQEDRENTDQTLKAIADQYQQAFGRMIGSPMMAEELMQLAKEHGDKALFESFRSAVKSGHRNGSPAYIRAILEREGKKPRKETPKGYTWDNIDFGSKPSA